MDHFNEQTMQDETDFIEVCIAFVIIFIVVPAFTYLVIRAISKYAKHMAMKKVETLRKAK